MSAQETAVEPLETWLSAKPYWEQLLWTFASRHSELSEEQIEICYAHLRRGVGVTVDTAPAPLPVSFGNTHDAPG